jgi:hypothetical protein
VNLGGWLVRYLPEGSGEIGETVGLDRSAPEHQNQQGQSLFDRVRTADSTPKYFEQLSEDDRTAYTRLQGRLFTGYTPPGTVDHQFSEALSSIRTFCKPQNDDDVFRSLVCGIVWLPTRNPSAIVVNTDQLSLLVGKSTARISELFQGLGYSIDESSSVSYERLAAAFPVLTNADLGGWRVRHLPEGSVETSETVELHRSPHGHQSEASQSRFDRVGTTDSTPKYFEQLSEDDRTAYTRLQRRLFKRYTAAGTTAHQFSEALSSIQTFCKPQNDDDVFRTLVCGIVWLPTRNPSAIVVNTDQLSLLLGKPTGRIKGFFQGLGYSTDESSSVSYERLTAAFPVLTNADLGGWRVRHLPEGSVETGETVDLDRSSHGHQSRASQSRFDRVGTTDSTPMDFEQLSEDDRNGPTEHRTLSPGDFGSLVSARGDDSDSQTTIERAESALGSPGRDTAEMGEVDSGDPRDSDSHRDSQAQSLPDADPWGLPPDYEDERLSDDDGDLPAPPDAAPSSARDHLRIFDPRTPIQYISLDGSEVHMTVVHDQFSYWTGGLLTTVDTRTGSIRTAEIDDVIEVAGNTEDNTFVMTTQSEVFLASVYERPYSILRWGEGHLSKLTAGHSNEPIFAARSGKTVVLGTQIGHQPIDFKREIVDIKLSDHYLYVSTDAFVTLFDTAREIGSYVPPSGVKSFCLLDGRQRLAVWGGNHLDIIDIRTSGTSCQRYDLDCDIDSVDLTIYPKLLAISGGESVSVVDWRWPLNVMARIDCSLRHGGAMAAKWMEDTPVLIIASEAGPTELYDFGGFWKCDIESYCEGAETETETGTGTGTEPGTGDGTGDETGTKEANKNRRRKEEIPSGPGQLVGVETSCGWAIVQKAESFTFVQNPADRIPPPTAETEQTEKTAKSANSAKSAEPDLRVRRRYSTTDEQDFAGFFGW